MNIDYHLVTCYSHYQNIIRSEGIYRLWWNSKKHCHRATFV